jgi:hypothetical protein
MAIAKLGPLVSEVRGSVGGVYFRRGGPGAVVTGWGGKVRRQSARTREQRDWWSRGAVAWRGLSAATQGLWTRQAVARAGGAGADGRRVSGFAEYMHAWGMTGSAQKLVTPGSPTTIVPTAPIWIATTYSDVDGLRVATLSRNLGTGEVAIFRAHRSVRTGSKVVPGQIVNVAAIDSGYGLGTVSQWCAGFDGVNDYMSHAGDINVGATTTIMLWVRFAAAQPAGIAHLVNWNVGQQQLYWIDGDGLYYADSIVEYRFVALGSAEGWHHIMLTMDVGGSAIRCYWDGVLQPGVAVGMGGDFLGPVVLGQSGGGAWWFEGRMEELTISNIVRPGSYCSSAYRGGLGRQTGNDGNTLGNYKFGGTGASLGLDVSGHGNNFNVFGCVPAVSILNTMIHPVSEDLYGSSRWVYVDGVGVTAGNCAARPERKVLAW